MRLKDLLEQRLFVGFEIHAVHRLQACVSIYLMVETSFDEMVCLVEA